LARHLVISATLLLGVLRAQPVVVPVVALPAVELAYSASPQVLQNETEPPAPEAAGDEEEQPTCVVRPRDSLWKLAEDHLGDGLRWRELWDLNRGREFPDGDVFADPDLIRPGWVLRLPPDATGGELEPGLNVGEVPDTSSPEPPTRPSPSPETVAEVPNRVARPTTARPTTTPVPNTAGTKAGGEEQGGVSVPQNLAPVIGSALAVGLVAYLGRLRLAQQRRREPGRTIPLPPESLVNPEAELRREATVGSDGATRLDLTLRAIASSLAASRGMPIPSIEAVSVTDDLVEILFSSPLRAPAGPFEVTAGGRAWTLPATVPEEDLTAAGAGQSVPVPALTEVGRIEDRQVFIDLESSPITTITGDTEGAKSLLWALAYDLATSGRADDLRIVVIGDPPPGLAALDRVEVVPSLGDVLEGLRSEAEATRTALEEVGCRSTAEARARQPADPWTPTVVLVATERGNEESHLHEVAKPKSGITVVSLGAGTNETARRLVVDGRSVLVTPPGLTLEAGGLPAELLAAAGQLLEVASGDGEGVDLLDDLEETPENRPGVAKVAPLALRLPPLDDGDAHNGRLLVKVLGSVKFVGSKSPLDRPQSRELVVYLALHPAGVDEGRLKTALWPDRAPQGGAFNEAVSRARRCLGLAADGSHHLPHVRDGIYRLGDGAATDFTLLESAYRRARISASEDTMAEVAEALALVRGLPFEGSRGFEWAHAEGFVSRMEGLVADAAGLIAEWSLGCEDHETAIWATRQGVKAAMADERLYQLRMRAHAAAGDQAGIEATVDELCAVLEIADPSTGLLSETMALYKGLRRPRRRVASR
jgi:DNA-binding SARP family transcriptional activator